MVVAKQKYLAQSLLKLQRIDILKLSSTQSGCFLMLWMLFPLALPENSGGAGRSSPLHRLLFGGVKQNAEDAPLCLRAQRPLGRRGWQVLALHRGSGGRAWCGSAGQRQEGRAWAARDARPLALLPQAQGGDEMVGMVLLLRRESGFMLGGDVVCLLLSYAK
ncbi:uncharacterized protein [Triticum aestivum]|uniref:uncharacterized protein n=1 Tax=Triticum aestivum TaxID=4565 RepID=UPI001D027B9D|nr:uncharacterized protein LOC123140768 [Triticum aestivum]